MDLIEGFEGLRRFYKEFEQRDSARIPVQFYPEDLRKLGGTWIGGWRSRIEVRGRQICSWRLLIVD